MAKQRFLEYPLENGYVDHWLLAGPQITPIEGLNGENWKEEAIAQWMKPELEPLQPPVERDDFHNSLTWKVIRCQGDHRVDASGFAPTRSVVVAWAYTHLQVAQPGGSSWQLTCDSPADVWLNGEQVCAVEGFSELNKARVTGFKVTLSAENDVFVRIAQAGAREVDCAFVLQWVDAPEGTVAQVPVLARFPARWLKYEELFDRAYLEEAVNYQGHILNLRFAPDTPTDLRYNYQIQDFEGMIYVEGTWDVELQDGLDIGHPQRIFERPAFVTLRAPGKEYFEQDLRCQQRIPVYILDNAWSDAPCGDYAARRQEGLQDAARREGLLFGEIAKMALGRWAQVDAAPLVEACEQIQARRAGSEVLLVGLLGAAERFGKELSFPAGVIDRLEEAAVRFAYEARADLSGVDFESESTQILLFTAQILAGQRFADSAFPLAEMTGAQLAEHGINAALEWIRARGRQGFAEWNSPIAIEKDLIALSHLVSLSENEELKDLTAVLMDKILFQMAVNNYKGVLAGATARATARYSSAVLKSAGLQATAGLMRMLWGMGVFSVQCDGVVSLALADYEFPSFYAEIATEPLPELLARSGQVGKDGKRANTLLYKTPDYALGSAQEEQSGERGRTLHAWQATLGPGAGVFVNHPLNFNQEESGQPGFWLGNASNPRVAQHKDALVAVYQSEAGNGLDFTHAYFPTYAFEEYTLEGGWAFGRMGQGYVAICCANGFDLMQTAPDGFRELRSAGRENVWVCQMGSVVQDGTFAQFRAKVLGQPVGWKPGGVEWTTARGETLSFGWQGAFTVNGAEEAITDFRQVDNPYSHVEMDADKMEIAFGEYLFQLNFE